MELTKDIRNQYSERRRNIEHLLRVCLGTFDSSLEFIMFLTHNLFLFDSLVFSLRCEHFDNTKLLAQIVCLSPLNSVRDFNRKSKV